MKIACVDKAAADRQLLHRFLEEAFAEHRKSVGHLPVAKILSCSLEELLFGSRPDVVVVGPQLDIEAAFAACAEIRKSFPNIPIAIFFLPERYSLRALRRFERFTKALFAWNEPSARFIHTLFELSAEELRPKTGRLAVISGVKGGVGASSYTVGLAHAAHALGKRSIAIDLSSSASLLRYLGVSKLHSPEYSTILTDSIVPQRDLVERLVTTAPNGISLLLPPNSSREMRELWLRDLQRFELSLRLVELLLEMYDLVLVDLAGAEGILPFGLLSRADSRILVTSNEPASVFLLHRQLAELAGVPGEGETAIAVQLLNSAGLTADDIFDFVLGTSGAQETETRLPALPYDARARNWIGTGNSLYTEGGRSLRKSLESQLRLLGIADGSPAAEETPSAIGAGEAERRRRTAGGPGSGKNSGSGTTAARSLPAFLKRFTASERETPGSAGAKERRMLPWLPVDDRSIAASAESRGAASSLPIMRPPRSNAAGNVSLEYALFLSGAIIVALVAVPEFFRAVVHFLSTFAEGG